MRLCMRTAAIAFAALSAESKAFYCGIFVKAFSLGEVRTAP